MKVVPSESLVVPDTGKAAESTHDVDCSCAATVATSCVESREQRLARRLFLRCSCAVGLGSAFWCPRASKAETRKARKLLCGGECFGIAAGCEAKVGTGEAFPAQRLAGWSGGADCTLGEQGASSCATQAPCGETCSKEDVLAER
jgi:hypothetical protein